MENDGPLNMIEKELGERSNPDKAAELHKLLKDWRKQINAPVPATANPEYDPQVEATAIRTAGRP